MNFSLTKMLWTTRKHFRALFWQRRITSRWNALAVFRFLAFVFCGLLAVTCHMTHAVCMFEVFHCCQSHRMSNLSIDCSTNCTQITCTSAEVDGVFDISANTNMFSIRRKKEQVLFFDWYFQSKFYGEQICQSINLCADEDVSYFASDVSFSDNESIHFQVNLSRKRTRTCREWALEEKWPNNVQLW